MATKKFIKKYKDSLASENAGEHPNQQQQQQQQPPQQPNVHQLPQHFENLNINQQEPKRGIKRIRPIPTILPHLPLHDDHLRQQQLPNFGFKQLRGYGEIHRAHTQLINGEGGTPRERARAQYNNQLCSFLDKHLYSTMMRTHHAHEAWRKDHREENDRLARDALARELSFGVPTVGVGRGFGVAPSSGHGGGGGHGVGPGSSQSQNPGQNLNPGQSHNPGQNLNPGQSQNPGQNHNPGQIVNPGLSQNPVMSRNPGQNPGHPYGQHPGPYPSPNPSPSPFQYPGQYQRPGQRQN